MSEATRLSGPLREFVDSEEWTFAKTMPEWPHEYLVRDRVDSQLFESLVRHIREHGLDGRFYNSVLRYFAEDGLLYWTMGDPIEETIIINRCREEESYENRLKNGTLPSENKLDLQYFEELQSRINRRLTELHLPGGESQINDFPWLYGALGSVPASVMFICENPSLKPMRTAHTNTIDGKTPDIEAQWWGGKRNNAAKRFRFVLHQCGLKTTPPSARGGWNCYITNVVKEANFAHVQAKSTPDSRREQARHWSDILAWELAQVKPKTIFCLGGRSEKAVITLQREKLLPSFPVHKIYQYTAYGTDDKIRQHMLNGIRRVLDV